jgi:hypothetical protein
MVTSPRSPSTRSHEPSAMRRGADSEQFSIRIAELETKIGGEHATGILFAKLQRSLEDLQTSFSECHTEANADLAGAPAGSAAQELFSPCPA